MNKKVKFGKKQVYKRTPKRIIRLGRALHCAGISIMGYSFVTEFKTATCVALFICMLGTFFIDYFGDE